MPGEVRFYVDGNLVHTLSVAIGAQMRPLASAFNAGGPAVTVDWLRMSPYASPSTFVSRVCDSSKSATDWLQITSTTQKPAGTNILFETRTGETATPDGTWSGWEAVGADGSVASPGGRYAQYRADLSTTDASASPATEGVTLGYRADEEAPDAPLRPDLVAASDKGVSNTDDLTNDATPTFGCKAEANSKLEIFDSGASLGTTTANGTGDYSSTVDNARGFGEGKHQIRAQARDAGGNSSDLSTTLEVTVDTIAPTTEPPEEGLVEGSRLGASTVPVELAWSATDDNGIASYLLQQCSDGGASYSSVKLATATATRITRSLAPSGSGPRKGQATRAPGRPEPPSG